MVGKKLGSEWELAKKPGSVFSIWREDEEQKEHSKKRQQLLVVRLKIYF